MHTKRMNEGIDLFYALQPGDKYESEGSMCRETGVRPTHKVEVIAKLATRIKIIVDGQPRTCRLLRNSCPGLPPRMH